MTAEELAPYLDVESTEKTVLFELNLYSEINAGSIVCLLHPSFYLPNCELIGSEM